LLGIEFLGHYGIFLSISTILIELNKGKKPYGVAVFLVIGLLAFEGLAFRPEGSAFANQGILGGPAGSSRSPVPEEESAFVRGKPILLATSLGAQEQDRNFQVLYTKEAILQDFGQPVGPAFYRQDLLVYTVQKGDTLSKVASEFGVTVQTIADANPKVRASALKIGEELLILPVSGFVYKTKDDDTLESVAALFNVKEDRIREVNPSVDFNVLQIDTPLIVPGAKRADYAYAAAGVSLSASDLGAYFILPTEGFNWGKLHAHNAVDVAGTCGTTVRAAAEGLVIPDESFGDGLSGWNGGYGYFVLIEHPLGDKVRTRYAHLDTVRVDIGNYVRQGQEIGTIGQTGDATGCHLHFEVYGAKNPFTRY